MFPLRQSNPDPTPLPEIPVGLGQTLLRAINSCTRKGAITVELLNGRPKAIVVPWYGDHERDPNSFSIERGDGEVIYTEPGCHLWIDLPPHMEPANFRMSVPVWLIQAASPAALHAGRGEVILAGHIHPLYNSALVDYYAQNRYIARRYYWDTDLNLRTVMNGPPLIERVNDIWEAGGPLGHPPLFAPRYAPLLRS
jgi:hypothetical protein